MKINKLMFREYDIRGIYPTEIDEDTAYTIGLGFGSYIKEHGKTTCIVGHDNRLSSPVLYEALVKGILSTGINIISLGLCTTPMYYYACIKLQVYSGVMVTASHNPKDDNGFKFAFDESGNCKGQEIQDFLAYILNGKFQEGQGLLSTYDIEPDYLELFKNNLHFGSRRIKVVIDPGNGTTSIIAKKLYEMFPIDLIVINGESDGHFPNHHPDPCVEENLNQRKEKIQTMISDISHQTAIPISNILVYSQLLEEDCADPQMREYGTVIRQQGEKLQFLLDSLVKISRLENGIIQTVPQKGELRELACQVKCLMEQKAGEKQISLEVKPGKEKAYAWFDRKWTREALMNLVDNAVKYTPAGGKVTLEVVSYSLFSRIDVRDTGIGIEEEELPEIFHRFYRSRDVLSEEGVGLGLYLAREIVRSQGGYIKVSSKKGEGSVFSVFLPSEKRENVSRL